MSIARLTVAFCLAGIAAVMTLAATGVSLGLAMGGFIIVALIVPPLGVKGRCAENCGPLEVEKDVDRQDAKNAKKTPGERCFWFFSESFLAFLASWRSVLFANPEMMPAQKTGHALEGRIGQRFQISLSVVVAIAISWLTLIGPGKATTTQWMDLVALLAAFALFVTGLAAFLEAVRVNSWVASAATAAMALAWLTWPVWMSQAVVSPTAAEAITHLVQFCPPLVANGILTFTPPWTEQIVAYQLTLLNQDLAISLPTSALPAILGHLTAGGIFLFISYCFKKK